MPLQFAAITPHSPILVPTIGKDNLARLAKTMNSYKKIGDFLSEQQIETTIIFSPHGSVKEDVFTMNVAPELNVNFEEFGDFSSKTKVGNDLETAEYIRDAFLENGKMKAANEKNLDFGAGVPSFLLFKDSKTVEIVPIKSSGLSLREHFEAGIAIGKILEKSTKKIAVIASSDLSHRLTKHSPAGYSPKGQKFDLRLVDLVHEKRIDDLLSLDEKTITEVKTCGLKTILMLFGTLYGAGADWEMLTSTYEAPFGVGYLTASLGIK